MARAVGLFESAVSVVAGVILGLLAGVIAGAVVGVGIAKIFGVL